jgi:hypothetical protein
MRDDEEVHRADGVERADEVELFVPCQIAEIDGAELAEGQHEADRTRVLRGVNRTPGHAVTGGIRLAASSDVAADPLAVGGDDLDAGALQREHVAGLHDEPLHA